MLSTVRIQRLVSLTLMFLGTAGCAGDSVPPGYEDLGNERGEPRIREERPVSTPRSSDLSSSPDAPGGTDWRLVFVSERSGARALWKLDPAGGEPEPLAPEPPSGEAVVFSPDGTRRAFSALRDDNRDLFVGAADGSDEMRLTTDPAEDRNPAWSPDGSRIAFESDRTGDWEIWVIDADGSDLRRLTDHEGYDGAPRWIPAGL